MDEQKLLHLIKKAAHIGERYGIASLGKDTDSMKLLKDDYQRLVEEARKLLQPLWGVSLLGQQYRTATEVMMRQHQAIIQQQMAPPLTQQTLQDAYDRMLGIGKEPEPEPEPIEIEFSL
jgi:hypothetical protein